MIYKKNFSFVQIYDIIKRKERKKKMKNNFFYKIFLGFLIIVVIFIGFKAISSISKRSEKISVNHGLIGGHNYEKAKIICNKEKVVRKFFEQNVGHQGYNLYIELENGKILSVDANQFQKAAEGNECKTIF